MLYWFIQNDMEELKMKLKFKKFEIFICILNVILILFMFVYLFHAFIGRKEVPASNAASTNTEFSFNEADDALTNVYVTLIKGTNVSIGKGKKLHFGTDGDFEGFFDEKEINVNGYQYEVIGVKDNADQDGAVAIVNVYNKDKTKYVQYKLVYGGTEENPELLLMYPKTGKTYEISIA